MKIVTLSDIHGVLPDIPECDLCLISGDICPTISIGKQLDWLDDHVRRWLKRIPAKRVVACAGNHDFAFAEHQDRILSMKLRWDYLQDRSVVINDLHIWGTPWQRRYYDWSFNLDESDLALKWALIPENTDIIVCHSPPYMFGDMNHNYEHLGSPSLLARIEHINPKMVVCGHIHPGYGVYKHNNTVIVNAANCRIVDNEYVFHNPPLVFDFENDQLRLL